MRQARDAHLCLEPLGLKEKSESVLMAQTTAHCHVVWARKLFFITIDEWSFSMCCFFYKKFALLNDFFTTRLWELQ